MKTIFCSEASRRNYWTESELDLEETLPVLREKRDNSRIPNFCQKYKRSCNTCGYYQCEYRGVRA